MLLGTIWMIVHEYETQVPGYICSYGLFYRERRTQIDSNLEQHSVIGSATELYSTQAF